MIEVYAHRISGVASIGKTWNCNEYNVTGSYIKIEIWYKFYGYSWTGMNAAFKTETFTQNTILNFTTWTIYLCGSFHQWEPLGPGGVSSTIRFYWDSSIKEQPHRKHDL